MGRNVEAMAAWERMLPRLRELAAQRCSGGEMTRILNREFNVQLTRNAVMGKLHRDDPTRYRPRRVYVPAPRPQPQHKPVLTRVQGAPVGILDLERHHCRFVVGDARDMLFCGALSAPGVSWCAAHMKVVYHAR